MKRLVTLFGIAVVILVHIAMLFGCKSRQAITQPTKIVELEKTVTKTIRDTTLIVESDSSFYQAWIECINGKPVLKKDTVTDYTSNPDRLKVPTVSLGEDGRLLVQAQTEILELHAKIEDLVTEMNTKTTEYISVEVEKELTVWQKLFIALGKVSFLAVIGVAVYGLTRLYKKINGK
ncbi:hypothetical protein [Sphingobacterium sp. LRF_L2]|uniref:hypothetical protein n=1 Tax=Sphingobacterium sp. LRF_L2 TaxID=3369421 RepID=UPI003F63A33F